MKWIVWTWCFIQVVSASFYFAPAYNRKAPVLRQISHVQSLAKSHIVGGMQVDTIDTYPWMASLQYSRGHYCGGAMIADTILVTAAHCNPERDGISLDEAFVLVDRLDWTNTSTGIEFNIVRVLDHAEYHLVDKNDFGYGKRDISMWLLSPRKNPQNATVVPIPLATLQDEQDILFKPSKAELQVVGWGRTQFKGHSSNTLLHADVEYVPEDVCHDLYSPLAGTEAIDSQVLCAGELEGGKSTCQGDSGGPLFQKNSQGSFVLLGLVSWANKCAMRNQPTVFTRISHYADWIQAAKHALLNNQPFSEASEFISKNHRVHPDTPLEPIIPVGPPVDMSLFEEIPVLVSNQQSNLPLYHVYQRVIHSYK